MIAHARQVYPSLSARRLCALLGVGRSWYYGHRGRPTQAERDVALRDAIERLVLEFPGYGYRRVTHALRREGWTVNHKRVLRVMRQESLLCQLKRRFVATTDSGHALRTYPNLAAGFAPTGPDQLWVADITYIRLPTAFVYLACVLDAWSRRCVGWQLSRLVDTELTLAALERALATRHPAPGLIHHSDRGVQYASADYVSRLEGIGARISMAAVGNPYENAKAESFFKTLKCEEVYLQSYQTFQEAEANLGRFIADVYNAKRLHSSLNYASPAEFEAAHADGRPPMTAAEQELITLEREWMEAIQRKDFATLERLVGADYAYTASGQGRWSRQQWMETVPVYDVHAFTFLDVDVRVYGDVAVVLPRVRQTASVAGATRSGEFLLTDVWVRRDGRWQVVARSSVLMPEAAEASQGATVAATDANQAVIRRLFAEVFNAGDVDAVAELVAPDVLGHDATSPEPKRGLESVRQVAVLFRTAFPDLRLGLEDLIAEGDKVVARWTLRGTHRGTFMGVPATGKAAATAGIVIYRLAEGKIAEYWGSFDALGLMRQLGAIPDPPDRAGS